MDVRYRRFEITESFGYRSPNSFTVTVTNARSADTEPEEWAEETKEFEGELARAELIAYLMSHLAPPYPGEPKRPEISEKQHVRMNNQLKEAS